MIKANQLIQTLKKKKINFFTGVPDSILKNFTNSIPKNTKHIIAANEGSAIALATGYHLSNNKLACVYLQNSGLGNAINPLVSIAHSKVYSIPMLLIIGWRGAPGQDDEPQHVEKGKITKSLLKLLDIKYLEINQISDLKKINKLIDFSNLKKKPVAILIKKNVIKPNNDIKISNFVKNKKFIKRELLIKEILKNSVDSTHIISTTGFTSRELYQIRSSQKNYKGKDFYVVGAMGHTSMIALGSSLYGNKKIICLDGDGSILMHLGNINTLSKNSKNIKYVLLNNGCHESVGGQNTGAFNINFQLIAKAFGFKKYFKITNVLNMKKVLKNILKQKGTYFIEVIIATKSISPLTRPKNLISIKKNFMSQK